MTTITRNGIPLGLTIGVAILIQLTIVAFAFVAGYTLGEASVPRAKAQMHPIVIPSPRYSPGPVVRFQP